MAVSLEYVTETRRARATLGEIGNFVPKDLATDWTPRVGKYCAARPTWWQVATLRRRQRDAKDCDSGRSRRRNREVSSPRCFAGQPPLG